MVGLGATLLLYLTAPIQYVEASDIHSQWNDLLKTYVSNGGINYSALKKKSSTDLDAYIEKMSATDPSQMSKDEQLAYYLNVYNANVVKGIVDVMPTRSVRRHKNFFKKSRLILGGGPLAKKKISLDDLEHKVIRPTFKDARVHFALVCAARGCPSLPNHAFTSKKLDHCLDHLAASFLNSDKGVCIKGKSVWLSSILDWYKEDFGGSKEDVLSFVGKYRKSLPPSPKVRYLTYNWALNSHRGKKLSCRSLMK